MKNNELTLLILAAGNAKRYGSLKQLEPVGPNDEFIMDYSIYNALKAGFTKVVFIIQKENLNLFKNTIESRIKNKIKVEYAFQESPLGTAHALYSSKNVINSPFVLINADDLYELDSFLKISDFLKNNKDNEFCVMGYEIKNTINGNLPVKRAILKTKEDNLEEIIESTITMENNFLKAYTEKDNEIFTLKDNTYVSMNMLGLTPSIFKFNSSYLKQDFNGEKEYQIPNFLNELINKKEANIKVFKTKDKCLGITYKEDLTNIKENIKLFINEGKYPNNLWK